MRNNNLDVTDAALNTNAPFKWECPLRLWGSTLPSGSFIAIKIYLPETAKPPVRLYSITPKEAAFHDAAGTAIGSWKFANAKPGPDGYTLGFITTKEGVLTGHVAADVHTKAILQQTGELAGGVYYTAPSDFILLLQCHVQSFAGQCRVVIIGTTAYTSNVLINTGTRLYTQISTENQTSTITTSLYGTYHENAPVNGICTLALGTGTPIDVGGKHLVIIPGVTSNLRIVNEGSGLVFKGVLDV